MSDEKKKLPPMDVRAPKGVYHVAFDTKAVPGHMVGLRITIEVEPLRDNEVMRVDLCEHPLYQYLRKYVLANPGSDAAD